MDEITGRLGDFLPPDLIAQMRGDFKACARYYAPMDHILYLELDCAYRADRVDQFLTILWHPDCDRAVGVKLKGFRFLFNRVQQILQPRGILLSNEDFFPLMSVLEVAFTAGFGPGIMAEAERQRLVKQYDKAREMLEHINFDPREVLEAA